MQLLRKWRDSVSDGTAVILVHGQGGESKTRLASELSRDWSDEGWLALSAFGHEDRFGPDVQEIPWTKRFVGVLVTVDYAERWSTADLLTLFGI